MYLHGHGAPQSYKEAVVWYRKVADQGNADARYNPGALYFHGNGVPQSYKETAVWGSPAVQLESSRLLGWDLSSAPTAELWSPLMELPSSR